MKTLLSMIGITTMLVGFCVMIGCASIDQEVLDENPEVTVLKGSMTEGLTYPFPIGPDTTSSTDPWMDQFTCPECGGFKGRCGCQVCPDCGKSPSGCECFVCRDCGYRPTSCICSGKCPWCGNLDTECSCTKCHICLLEKPCCRCHTPIMVACKYKNPKCSGGDPCSCELGSVTSE